MIFVKSFLKNVRQATVTIRTALTPKLNVQSMRVVLGPVQPVNVGLVSILKN